jgi:hypothetical protein
MSNIFKGNSRFSALLDDTKDLKKEKHKDKVCDQVDNKKDQLNSFKSSEKKESRFKKYDEKEKERHRLERERELNTQKESKNKEKDQLNLESLSMDNFPELISVSKKETNKPQCVSYIDVLKKEEEIDKSLIDPDLVNLQPGWLLIKKDRQTGNTIMKYGVKTVFYEEPKNLENEIGLDIYEALVERFEKRKEEFIELNGYDTWEKIFKYPNWQEREAYLYEIEEFEDNSDDDFDDSDNEYIEDDNDDEYYDDY